MEKTSREYPCHMSEGRFMNGQDESKRHVQRKPQREVMDKTGGRMFLSLKQGLPICVTVTLVDGIVVARSAFNSSMNYRSVMAFGIPRVLEGDEKHEGLVRVTNAIVPGFWDEARDMSTKESAQTMVFCQCVRLSRSPSPILMQGIQAFRSL